MRKDDGVSTRRALKVNEVLEIVRVGRSTLYRMERDGLFPPSTYISPNRRIWWEDQVINWQNEGPPVRRSRRRWD